MKPLIVLAFLVAFCSAACNWEENVDFWGNEYKKVTGIDENACCQQCNDDPLCNAITFVKAKTNECRFKNSDQGRMPAPATGYKSAVVRSATTCPFGFLPCANNGACAVFASQCTAVASCGKGQVICPTGTQCMDKYEQCNLPDWLNAALSTSQRAKSMVQQMTLDEKVKSITTSHIDLERLGVMGYDWGNEALHGTCSSEPATVFPQVLNTASTWNRTLWHSIGRAIADEARAAYNKGMRTHTDIYGVSFYAPNLNIYRDPRWGRGEETSGEDPFLTSRYVVEYITGVQQGPDPKYPQTFACCKHFVAYSLEHWGSYTRHNFNAIVNKTDMISTYLPAFEACVREAKAGSVMCSYNRVNGVPTCADPWLMNDLLRTQWGFDGFVVSDFGSIADIHDQHKYTQTQQEAVADAIKAGCDQEGGGDGWYPKYAPDAINQGLMRESDVDLAMQRLTEARIKLGQLDPPNAVSYNTYPYSLVNSPEHTRLALEAAQQSILLLKNTNKLLPLRLDDFKPVSGGKKLALIGIHPMDAKILLGNYNGIPKTNPSVYDVLKTLMPESNIMFSLGCESIFCLEPFLIEAAIDTAQQADVVVLMPGLDSHNFEGESRDRKSLEYPGFMDELIEGVVNGAKAKGKPVILAMMNAGATNIHYEFAQSDAVVQIGYPGQSGAQAFWDVIFGVANPSARLTTTWPAAEADLGDFTSMSMQAGAGRTYRYYSKTPLLSFGYGLSYSNYSYANLHLSASTIQVCQSLQASIQVTNAGDRSGSEVVQMYLRPLQGGGKERVSTPKIRLTDFNKVFIERGATTTVTLNLAPRQMAVSDPNGSQLVIEPGTYSLYVGASQPNTGLGGLAATVTVTGQTTPLSQCP